MTSPVSGVGALRLDLLRGFVLGFCAALCAAAVSSSPAYAVQVIGVEDARLEIAADGVLGAPWVFGHEAIQPAGIDEGAFAFGKA